MQGVLVQGQGEAQKRGEGDGDKASGYENQRGPDGVEDDLLEEVGCAPVALHEGFGEAVAEVRAGDNDDAEHGDDVEDAAIEQDGAKEGGGVDEGEVEFAGEFGCLLAGDEAGAGGSPREHEGGEAEGAADDEGQREGAGDELAA